MIRTIFNARSALFFGLLMGTIPTFFAQEAPAVAQQESLPMPVDQEDGKAEKKVAAEQEAAQEEEKKKKYAAIVLPAEIPLVPHDTQLKKMDKEGGVIAETLSMADDEYETFTGQSFAELIKEAISWHKIPLIARVVTTINGRHEAHYFDIAGIHSEITGSRGVTNPINRQPIQELSYFAYIPQLERFVFVDNSYLQESEENLVLQSVDQIHDAAMSILFGEAYIAEDKNKSIEMYRYLINYSRVPEVKNKACYRLGMILREQNINRNEQVQEACDLFESLIDEGGNISEGISEEVSIVVFLNLANGYHVNLFDAPWTDNNHEAALYYAMRAINHTYWDSLELTSKVMMYAVAGENLLKKCAYLGEEDDDARFIISFLEKGLKLLGESQDELSLNLKARLYANLAVAYSSNEIMEICEYEKQDDHHMMVWEHCSKALERYHVVGNAVKGFLPLVIRMRYFGIGNEGNVKEAFEYMEKCKEDYSVFDVIRCHRDYYHTPSGIGKDTPSDREKVLKELSEKDTALAELQDVAQDYNQDSEEVCLARAILGQIYAEKSQKAFDQALLYAKTDPTESLVYNNQGRELHERAQEYMKPLLELPQHKDTYPWALAYLTCGHIARASKNYKKAAKYFVVVSKSLSFPMLANTASSEVYTLSKIKKTSEKIWDIGTVVIEEKDSKFDTMQLSEVLRRLSKAHDKDALDKLEPHLIGIAKEAPGCMDRWKAQGALKEIAERRKKLSAATPVAAQSASMSLDSSLDGEPKAETAAASTVAAMDESPDKRGAKRKAGEEVEGTPGAKKSESAGAGSGSGSGPLMLVQKN